MNVIYGNVKYASPKQMKFVKSLLVRIGKNGREKLRLENIYNEVSNNNLLTFATASNVISSCLRHIKKIENNKITISKSDSIRIITDIYGNDYISNGDRGSY
jgi:hypothetical protein